MPLLSHQTEADIHFPNFMGQGSWKIQKLTPITILFGKNGSGKSLLLRAWRDADVRSCHYIAPERGGDIGFNPSFFQQQIDPQQRRDVTSRNYVSEYRQQIVGRIQAYFSARGDTRRGELPGDPQELEKFLSQLLPDFDICLSGVKNPPYRLIRTANSADVSGIDQLSSGEAQLLTIGLDLLTIAAIWDIQNTSRRVMLVDEPDAHIHPDLQARFADFLISVADRYKLQIVIATHSTTLLAAIGQFGGDSASVVYLDRFKKEFVAEGFTRIHKELAACLGGHALMGPLFGVPLLLVEGDDDYRIWSQVPRYHVVNLSVIPTNGGDEMRQYQRSLERIFEALREERSPPAGYALLDGDKPLPQESPQSSQRHVRFIKLACRESENLYLTDEVLSSFGVTWEQAVQRIVSRASEFGQKGHLLSEAPGWDRRQSDVKDVIHQLVQILDPKLVHWTMRVATAMGRKPPSGQLYDFLGERVVTAIWGNAK